MARTPDTAADHWAVIFTSQATGAEDDAYAATARRMEELAATMPGFLGVESARDPSGLGITVSYWRTEEDLLAWKRQAEHLEAQARGRSTWYSSYTTRVARVRRSYTFSADD